MAKEKAKVIAIANQKGGIGKTTSVIEIASALSMKFKKKVLIIDFDQQRNCSKYIDANMDVNEQGEYLVPTIYDYIASKCDAPDCIQHLEHFDAITASRKLSKADIEFTGPDDMYLLSDVIGYIKEDFDYDYILIDNGPTRNLQLTMVYIAADEVIIPTEVDDGSIDGILEIYADLKKLRDSRNKLSHAFVSGIILTRFEKTFLHNMALSEDLEEISDYLEKDNGHKPFILPVRKTVRFSECKKARLSLRDYEPSNKAVEDYTKIAEHIVKGA